MTLTKQRSQIFFKRSKTWQISDHLTILYYIFPMVVVDQNPFYYAAIGGIILGLATSLNYCFRGKVTGMSGMVYGLLFWHRQDVPEKLTIVGGMLVASGMFFDIFQYGTYNNFTPFGPEGDITKGTSYIGYGVAGLLVGFGTKLGNGCTSGHGLCGVSRFSIRSLVAVLCFLTSALAISTIRYHITLDKLTDEDLNPQYDYQHLASANVCIGVGIILPFLAAYLSANQGGKHMNKWEIIVDEVLTFLTGLIFGLGLLVSGMVRRSNILGFLGLGADWNPSLLFVLGCGVVVNLISFNYMIRKRKISFLGHELFNPTNSTIDWKLLLGATMFGLGWGIAGLCPGPAIVQLSIFTIPVHVIWFGFLFIGMFIARKVEHFLTEKEKEERQEREKIEAESKVLHPHMHSIHHKHHLNSEKVKQQAHQRQNEDLVMQSNENMGVEFKSTLSKVFPQHHKDKEARQSAVRESEVRDSSNIIRQTNNTGKPQERVRENVVSSF